MLNLTTLAPDIIAAIVTEWLPPEVSLFELAEGDADVVGGAAKEVFKSKRGPS